MEIRSTSSTITVGRVIVDGRLDATSAPDLRRALTDHVDRGIVDLVVDLAAVTFIDSAGLAALVSGMKRLRQDGGDLRLVRPATADAFRVFELTRFDRVFRFTEAN